MFNNWVWSIPLVSDKRLERIWNFQGKLFYMLCFVTSQSFSLVLNFQF